MATKYIQGQNVTGKLFCLKWFKTVNLNEKILVAQRKAPSGPKLQIH